MTIFGDRILVDVEVAAGAEQTLTPQPPKHSLITTRPALNRNRANSGVNSVHAQISTIPTLSTGAVQTLTVQDVSHALLSTTQTILVERSLDTQDATHAQIATIPSPTGGRQLSAQDAVHNQTVDVLSLEIDRQPAEAALERFDGHQVREELPLVVVGPAGIEISVSDLRLERVALPKLQRVGGLDVIVAVTNSDEVNLLLAMYGKKMGKHVIVRVKENEFVELFEELGVKDIISPEKRAAMDIANKIVWHKNG